MADLQPCSIKVWVFATKASAEKAIAELQGLGYRADQVGLVAQDESGKLTKTGAAAETGGVGVAFGAVSVLNPVVTVGTVCTATLTADGGSSVASMDGALIEWSVSKDDQAFCEREVRAGRCVVTVHCGERTDVAVVFARHGGYNRATAQAVSG